MSFFTFWSISLYFFLIFNAILLRAYGSRQEQSSLWAAFPSCSAAAVFICSGCSVSAAQYCLGEYACSLGGSEFSTYRWTVFCSCWFRGSHCNGLWLFESTEIKNRLSKISLILREHQLLSGGGGLHLSQPPEDSRAGGRHGGDGAMLPCNRPSTAVFTGPSGGAAGWADWLTGDRFWLPAVCVCHHGSSGSEWNRWEVLWWSKSSGGRAGPVCHGLCRQYFLLQAPANVSTRL